MELDGIITEVFYAFRTVPKPTALKSCDCGSCFSSEEAKELFTQHPEDMDFKLLSKCFQDYSVTQDKEGMHYLMPAFMKAVLETTISGVYKFDFYTWRFGRFLQEIGIETWPEGQ